MMKKFLPGALGALIVLASCSQNEVAEINRDGDEIRFNVVTNKATKAADVYCNANMPSSFYVSAISDGKTYIAKDEIKNVSGSWQNQNGTRYWPEESVSFYAHVNGGNFYAWEVADDATGITGATAKFESFKVEDQVADQKDLLYAVKTNQSKKGTPVELNFRHALSQIVFQARNDSENLYVVIEGVTVANVGNINTFTFPSANTDSNIKEHDKDPHDDGATNTGVYEDDELEGNITYNDSWGKWDENGISGKAKYNVSFTAVSVIGNKQLVSLTTANDVDKTFNKNAMLLLPQGTNAWAPEVNPKPSNEENTGSYFLVNCRIYNVATPNVEDENGGWTSDDVCLWGELSGGEYTSKELAIPVAFNWEQGKKYVYTFVFGNGNGGYNPDPEDPDPEKPEPVLVPITFTITVDDFVPVDGGDIESGLPESGE